MERKVIEFRVDLKNDEIECHAVEVNKSMTPFSIWKRLKLEEKSEEYGFYFNRKLYITVSEILSDKVDHIDVCLKSSKQNVRKRKREEDNEEGHKNKRRRIEHEECREHDYMKSEQTKENITLFCRKCGIVKRKDLKNN